MTTQVDMQKQIQAYLNLATAKEIHDGKLWYVRAHADCLSLADIYGLEIETVIGIVAALSPRNKWERNMSDAEQVILHGMEASVATFKANKIKAVRIRNGENPLNVLGGNKVRNFYRCILWYTNSYVCVDGHAYAVATANGERIQPRTISDAVYGEISYAYQQVAQDNSLLPCEVQAITWITYRRIQQVR